MGFLAISNQSGPAFHNRKETARFPGVDVRSDGLALHLKAGVRLPLLVAVPQDTAQPVRLRIRGTSMIDQHGKTELLIARLKESLPIEANITPPLAKLLAEKSPETPIPAKCNVISVFYTGDTGGITCGLDIGGPHTKTPWLVSITHLAFHRHVPLSREIEAYQRHRTKKLRQQQDRGY